MNLSILVATPPGYNPGMSAVEAGLRLFLRKHGLESSATAYRIHDIADRMTADERADPDLQDAAASSGLVCRSLAGREDRERFLAGDRILFWGDFLHMAQYVDALAVIDRRLHPEDGTRAEVRDHLLLADAADDVLARTCSFGTTLLFNTLQDELSSDYGSALARFVAGVRGIWVRDVVSAGKVAQLCGNFRHGFWGGDGAQLLDRQGLATLYPECASAGPADSIGYFIGRSTGIEPPIAATAGRLAEAFSMQSRWLPWGSRSAFPALASDSGHATLPFPQLLGALLRCRMVVTDTYHLGVVAWTLGIPAVTFFDPSAQAVRNVNSGRQRYWRDKREVFHSQYDVLDFLVRPEEAARADALAARIDHILSVLRDESVVPAITARIRNHADAASGDLAQVLVDDDRLPQWSPTQ
jgi:hypothetical protein